MAVLVIGMASGCRFSLLWSAASLAASPVTSGQVLTPAPASHSSLRRSLLSCQLVTGQERRVLESSPNRFDHNGNFVDFPGHELMLS